MRTLILTSIYMIFSIVTAQNTLISDQNFEQTLINLGYDIGSPDGSVITANINSITNLNISNNNISDLSGIEDFTSLVSLNCANNQLTSLDLSQNTQLDTIICSDNDLTYLNVTQNSFLKYIDCDTNNLQNIDLTQNILLQTLSCSYNYMYTMNVSQNISLVSLSCIYNFLSNLDVSNNLKLVYLNCGYNTIVELDVSQNTVLNELYCQHNYLRCLNVSNGNNMNFVGLTSYFNNLLTCIQVDDENWASSNWNNTYGTIPGVSFNFDAQNTFSNYCNDACSGVLTSIDELPVNYELKVFPNPFSSSTNIEIPNKGDESYTLLIYDMLGNQLRFVDNLNSNNVKIEKNNLPGGLYFFELSSDKQSFEGKFMIK